jgi:hypothetical protein
VAVAGAIVAAVQQALVVPNDVTLLSSSVGLSFLPGHFTPPHWHDNDAPHRGPHGINLKLVQTASPALHASLA